MPDAVLVTECAACHGQVSVEAARCPHCGHPRKPPPISAVSEKLRKHWALVVVGVVGVLIAAFNMDFRPRSGAPRCDGPTDINHAKTALKNAPALRMFGVEVAQHSNVITVSRASTEVVCRADVILNSAVRTVMSYRFFVSQGEWMVEARLDDL